MDNYMLSASRKRRLKSRKNNKWRRRTSAHYRRWLESMSPEELNIFIGVHGPNRIPKIKDRVRFTVQPYLEVISRVQPDAAPKIYPLGPQSTLNIVGVIDFKQVVDKKRNLYKLVVYVIQNDAAQLGVEAPKEYEHKLPFYKRRIFCPLAGAKFRMRYMAPQTADEPQGFISKIYHGDETFEQYIPRSCQS